MKLHPPVLPTRRRFLVSAGVLATAPFILPRRSWAGDAAPSRRITFGCIGMGTQMRGHLGALLGRDEVEVLAVCDVDTTRREIGRAHV